MQFRVGVDGGGSTTRAVVIDESSAIRGRAQSESSNLYNLGLQNATANIDRAIRGALDTANIGADEVESWGFGLAGAVGVAEKARWREALEPLYGADIAVDEDVVAALAGAVGADGWAAGGAILIAGTGANCFGSKGSGERRRVDGWGPLLGDRGSGYWLGESAIRAAVAALDSAQAPTLLSQALLKYFEVADLDALVGVVYASDFRRDRVAGFVPQVLDAADNGDAVAVQLLQQSGQLLAQTACAVLQPLGLTRLALTGGLLENASLVRDSLQHTLREMLGHEVEIGAPRFEAVVGAALLPMLEG